MIIIFDVDGTLMDIEHRRHFVDNGRNDWNAFLDPTIMSKDIPNKPVVAIANTLNTEDNLIIIVSARNERHREVTAMQMAAIGLGDKFIFLRADDDFRSDDEFKRDVLNELISRDLKPDLVFDDRNRVVDMWRANGIPCFQVAPGDF